MFKALAELTRTGQKQRFNRLQVLLSRSQMYSTYILGRLNARREAEKRRLERMEKKSEDPTPDENKEKESEKSEEISEKDQVSTVYLFCSFKSCAKFMNHTLNVSLNCSYR